MKRREVLVGSVACVAAVTLSAALSAAPINSDLLKQAKISQAQAEKTALGHVPNGIIKSEELEREHGKLIWSFDIGTSGTKNITEVQVDAKSGKIIST